MLIWCYDRAPSRLDVALDQCACKTAILSTASLLGLLQNTLSLFRIYDNGV